MKRTNDFYYLKSEKGYEIYDGATNLYFGSETTEVKAKKSVKNLKKVRRNFILSNN
jgi:hypothetical protein